MKRILNKAKNFKEAEEYDIFQNINMSPYQRHKISFILKKKIYGNKIKDIRKFKEFKKIRIK